MKHNLFFLRRMFVTAMLTAVTATTVAQVDPCPGFRNTMSFSSSSSLYFWSARVGDRISSGASTGYNVMSTCAASNCTTIMGHNNIMSTSYNSGPDQGINCCGHGTLWDAAQDHRFMIITQANAGLDELTTGSATPGLQRIPEGYTSSVRLGDPRATREGASTSSTWNSSAPNKSSEALFYTMYVTPENALLFINYAVVGRCYDHPASVAGEFLIRVVKQNDANGSWPNAPINDSMWFRISAPAIPSNNVPPAPWVMGRPCSAAATTDCYCTSSTCAYVYKPWAKVAISLNAYLYSNVRIEMYTSDCVPTYDPVYAYICGDYQAMLLTASGCPDPESSVIDTLHAPKGMLSYRWYVASRGPVADSVINMASYMDTVQFRQVWPPEGDDTLYDYAVGLNDFVVSEGPLAGDTVSRQTFKCVMTSALDPDKPFESRIYANINNRKPNVNYWYEASCDTTVTFQNISTIYAFEGQNDDSTYWVMYSDTLGTSVLDTVPGNLVTYRFPAAGHYGVRLSVTTAGDPCTANKFFTVEAIGRPPADFTVESRLLCESDQLVLTASDAVQQEEGLTLQWAVDDSVQSSTASILRRLLPVGKHVVSLTTTNAAGCSNTTYDSVVVMGQPYIDLSSAVSAICLGDSLVLSAGGNISYTWNAAPYDPALDSVQGRSSFTVHPTVSTTYYLLPAEDNPCSVDGAEVYVEVIPYPTPTIRTDSPHVDKENPVINVQDISPYGATSHWAFSDGGSADGTRVSYTFSDLTQDSAGITLTSCNRLDCCDSTTIWLPIDITTVWFPNTFIPDAESNNRFGIYTTLTLVSYEIYIYNRQGQLVHTSTDPNTPWDGTLLDGSPAPQGSYAWFCRYAYNHAATYTRRGTVTLLR